MSPHDDIQPGPLRIASAEDLGRVLRTTRKRQGLTQLELAEAAGLSRQHLGAIEGGVTTERIEELFRLLELLGVDLLLHRRVPGRGGAA